MCGKQNRTFGGPFKSFIGLELSKHVRATVRWRWTSEFLKPICGQIPTETKIFVPICVINDPAAFETLEAAGLPVDPALAVEAELNQEGGYAAARDLLTRTDRPTAVFAGSDMQALGVLRAARRLGLDVPGDLSIIGYDNLPVTAWTDPALTTVNQPLRELGVRATRRLLARIQKHEASLGWHVGEDGWVAFSPRPGARP